MRLLKWAALTGLTAAIGWVTVRLARHAVALAIIDDAFNFLPELEGDPSKVGAALDCRRMVVQSLKEVFLSYGEEGIEPAEMLSQEVRLLTRAEWWLKFEPYAREAPDGLGVVSLFAAVTGGQYRDDWEFLAAVADNLYGIKVAQAIVV